jgi:hypothetical protein
MDGKDCEAKTCAEDNYSRVSYNWNQSIRKWIRGNTRRIARQKEGWFETTLFCTHNRTLAQGHDLGSYEGEANTKGAYT